MLVLGLKINPHHLSVFVMWFSNAHTASPSSCLPYAWIFNLERCFIWIRAHHLKFIHSRSLSLSLSPYATTAWIYRILCSVAFISRQFFKMCHFASSPWIHSVCTSWAELAQYNTTQQTLCKAEAERRRDASGEKRAGKQASSNATNLQLNRKKVNDHHTHISQIYKTLARCSYFKLRFAIALSLSLI